MPETYEIGDWVSTIRSRYENYLKTSFYFKNAKLRKSFQEALNGEILVKGPFPEPARKFKTGINEKALAELFFPGESGDILPGLQDRSLWNHQERAIRATFEHQQNVVVATGTASGKTESFLYPILFSLYQQYLNDQLNSEGVRALVLYPMNALANDQRRRLGEICKKLEVAGSKFKPTFGQYIGQTPEDINDNWRHARKRYEERLPGEIVFRKEMRKSPPHILLTNYSMLEYLLIRPDDSPLFDNGRGFHWEFIVLDEAHQYRGTKGMEMGMLIRRLKQRLSDGGGENEIRFIATSATITSSAQEDDKQLVASFAKELFGEPFNLSGIIFEYTIAYSSQTENQLNDIGRYHIFVRALEGAFLIHENGHDLIVLNRTVQGEDIGTPAVPIEIALCRECGQHYYVGRNHKNKLLEGIRDPSQSNFGVEYYLPLQLNDNLVTHYLCRQCGTLSTSEFDCGCNASIPVLKCCPHPNHPDQLKECESCGYRRGGVGDPVQEIVHGSDGPNTVIATALHGLLPEERRKVLAFADSRQEAAFFAWYAENSYEKLRDRNLILRALREYEIDKGGLSLDDIRSRLVKQWNSVGLFLENESSESQNRKAFTAILREALTDERRLSLAGVGLVDWTIEIPEDLMVPASFRKRPWNFTEDEARQLMHVLLDEIRIRRAFALPNDRSVPNWIDLFTDRPQLAFCKGGPGGRKYTRQWGSLQSAIVSHFLTRLLEDSEFSVENRKDLASKLMEEMWTTVRSRDQNHSENNRVLLQGSSSGTFRLNSRWLRLNIAAPDKLWACNTCFGITNYNIRNVCPRFRCPGKLSQVDIGLLNQNHYRILYENDNLPPSLHSMEHTAQIASYEAGKRQEEFKKGSINLLSSSTTFEMGVDLGDLDVVFLRNVPPEPFNYTQRVGRAGRRQTPGLAVTYCRRNPHDLYHYEDPDERIIRGAVRPPRLRMTNSKIISRHIVAVALAAFFKSSGNGFRFKNVSNLVNNWNDPKVSSDLQKFCRGNSTLKHSLLAIVPSSMHSKCRLNDDTWFDEICGPTSRLAFAEYEVSSEYCRMKNLRQEYFEEGLDKFLGRIKRRMDTIAEEDSLSFLSRKAIIPKYGFPVDVVGLDTHPDKLGADIVSLERDLSQAIAEYAPGGEVIANKRMWMSHGVKLITGKQFPIKQYNYDDARNFQHWNENEFQDGRKKYLEPIFGFVTPLFAKFKEPSGRVRRLYTTRPFFKGFGNSTPSTQQFCGIKVTKALPGSLVVLCEGRNQSGFYICNTCGTHISNRSSTHKTWEGANCDGVMSQYSLGHELVTDVVRLQFPHLTEQWDAYSVAFAVLLGAADILGVPSTELDVTIAGGEIKDEAAIVLYDNVPGGAGLVAEFEIEKKLRMMLEKAKERVEGGCGCDISCYGCLRSYRNQFAHPYLNRNRALEFLTDALN